MNNRSKFFVLPFIGVLHAAALTVPAAYSAEPVRSEQAERGKAPVGEKSGRFDRERARGVIEAHGYDHIRGMKQDRTGVWRATATRYGKSVSVEVDQLGNFYD